MMKFAVWGFTIFICVYTILYYISAFSTFEIAPVLLAVSGMMLILFSGIYLDIKAFSIQLFLMISALVIQLATDGSVIKLMMGGTTQMSGLIVLLLIVPIISWILEEEPYIKEIMSFAHKLLDTSKRFYFGVMIINQIIAYFLLFGAIPMMYQFVNGFLGTKRSVDWENYKGTALLRSFSLTTLWVISIPSFAFAVDHLGASLGLTIIQGFVISVGGIMLSVVFLHFKEKKYSVDITAGIHEELEKVIQYSNDSRKTNRNVFEFIFLFFILFGTIFLLHIIMGWDLLRIIPPIVVIFTCFYFLLKKKNGRLFVLSKQYITREVKTKSQQISMLLSAGLLIFSVNQSGFGTYIVDSIFYISNVIPFLNFLLILPFVVILLGFLGLGPLTVIVLVAGILESVNLPYPPELVVLSITSGSVISILLSPFILPVIVLSGSNGLSVVKNSFMSNFGYSLAFYFMVQAYIQFMIYFVL